MTIKIAQQRGDLLVALFTTHTKGKDKVVEVKAYLHLLIVHKNNTKNEEYALSLTLEYMVHSVSPNQTYVLI